MTKRGKVLRDTTLGPGLLILEGQQYRFSLEGMWKSDVPPKPGLVVDVELDAAGRVRAITVVPETQLAREQAEVAMALARQKGQNLASSLVTKTPMPSLLALGLLAIAWFVLTTASIQVPFPDKQDFTFWQLLGFMTADNVPQLLDQTSGPSPSKYGFVAMVALAGPFLHHFWNDRRALFGGLLPLIFMVVVGIAVRNSLQRALGSGINAEAVKQAQDHAMKAVSLGLGGYLSILAGLYFAFTSAKDFLIAKASEAQGLEPPQRKAA